MEIDNFVKWESELRDVKSSAYYKITEFYHGNSITLKSVDNFDTESLYGMEDIDDGITFLSDRIQFNKLNTVPNSEIFDYIQEKMSNMPKIFQFIYKIRLKINKII